MARIGEKRVDDVLIYERDIKGKRIIRLNAGVCSGKNYWLTQIAKANPDLRILLITSRKNTVIAQAKKMNAGKFIDLDRLIDAEDYLLVGEPLTRVVCTNAGIEKFFKERFDVNDQHTYLWKKFDLIVLDEAHSLTTDATFTEAFYTEWLIKHTANNNPCCDVVVMSGTQEPINWLFKGNVEQYVHELDCFDECIHLEPDCVDLVPQSVIPWKLHRLWQRGKRMVYFANHRTTIAYLTKELIRRGVPADVFGYSFNNPSEVANKFPKGIGENLKDKIDYMNTALTTVEKVPSEVKILFSTSKNKEGINILDDDIKIVFAETHNKADLKQIAGRVRGNPETGTGIEKLVVVTDAIQHDHNYSELERIICKNSLDSLNKSLEEYQSYFDTKSQNFELESFFEGVYNKFRYVRYDYVTQKFKGYKGKVQGEKQHAHDCLEFAAIVKNYNSSVFSYNRTGRELFLEEWFPWSRVLLFNSKEELKEIAREKLYEYLVEEELLGKVIKKEQRDAVVDKLREMADIYGYDCIGTKVGFKSLGPAIKALDFKLDSKSNGVSYIITDIRESEKK